MSDKELDEMITDIAIDNLNDIFHTQNNQLGEFSVRLAELERKLELIEQYQKIDNEAIRKYEGQIAKLKKTIKSMVETNMSNQDRIIELENLLNVEIKDNNQAFDNMDKEINELKEEDEHVKHIVNINRDGVSNLFTNYGEIKEVLRDFYKHKLDKADYTIECLSSKEHVAEKMVDYVKNDIIFYKKQLEKLDARSAGQTEKRCVDCRKYETEDCPLWPTKGPNHWCTQFEPKASGGEKELGLSKRENGFNHSHGKLEGNSPLLNSKLPEPEKVLECHGCGTVISDGKYWCVKCLKDSENLWEKPYYELIEELSRDFDELIAWANNYPKDYEIYIRLKRKREKWQGRLK